MSDKTDDIREEEEWEERIATASDQLEVEEDKVIESEDENSVLLMDDPEPKEKKDVSSSENVRKQVDNHDEIPMDVNYLGTRVSLINDSFKMISKHLNILTQDLTKKEKDAEIYNPNSIINRVSASQNTPMSNNNAEFLQKAFDEHDIVPEDNKDMKSTGKKYSGTLRGNKAVVAVASRIRGVRRIHLYNSGFWVAFKPMSNEDIDNFFRAVDQEAQELGRTIGGHYFMVHDLFVKEKFMDLASKYIVSTNLVNYTKANEFTKAVSIHDYDTIVAAFCCMVYQNGLIMDIACVNDECNYISRDFKLDLERIRLKRNDLFSAEDIAFSRSNDSRKLSELVAYREALHEPREAKYENFVFHLKVPSIYDYFEYGNKLIGILVANVHDANSTFNRTTITRSVFYMQRIYVPWISKMDILDEEGEVQCDTYDLDGYHAAMEEIFNDIISKRTEKDPIGEVIEKFIGDTRYTFFGYHSPKCKKCGHEGSGINDMYALDPQQLFFEIAHRRLVMMGIA